ncbi:hypothetical protein PPE03_30250 [Pseudoalteromonas peptidolytica]|nr:hypothetical protein PPE03_30250 [Pseudoalteromonas peptidolytica]
MAARSAVTMGLKAMINAPFVADVCSSPENRAKFNPPMPIEPMTANARY